MKRLSLTMPYRAVSVHPAWLSGAIPAVSVLGAIGGALLALTLNAMWPLAISVASALAYGWLMHTQPLEQEVEYFSADEDGLRYVHAAGRERQVSRYQWTEILAVSLADGGLTVQTGRGALKGAAVFMPMRSAADSQAASAAAAHWLAAYRL